MTLVVIHKNKSVFMLKCISEFVRWFSVQIICNGIGQVAFVSWYPVKIAHQKHIIQENQTLKSPMYIKGTSYPSTNVQMDHSVHHSQ